MVSGPVFTESPLRGLHFLALSLSVAVVDWAPHQLAQLGWMVIPGIVLVVRDAGSCRKTAAPFRPHGKCWSEEPFS